MNIQAEKWLIGAALAVALPVLLPIIKKTAGPLVEQGSDLAKDLVKQARIMTVKARHEIEDIWMESQYERMQKNWERTSYSYTD